MIIRCEYCNKICKHGLVQEKYCSQRCRRAVKAIKDCKPLIKVTVDKTPTRHLIRCKLCGGEPWIAYGKDGKWYIHCIRNHNFTNRHIIFDEALKEWNQNNLIEW